MSAHVTTLRTEAFSLFQPDQAVPLVMDSPHSSSVFPSDFNAAHFLLAEFARTYIDPNRNVGEGGAGIARADVVLGDRDGTTCSSEFTHLVKDFMQQCGKGPGYEKLNLDLKGFKASAL
jgi:N-formylglutamate amidohydrolase